MSYSSLDQNLALLAARGIIPESGLVWGDGDVDVIRSATGGEERRVSVGGASGSGV